MLRCEVVHPSAAYRRGVGFALDSATFEFVDAPSG
jgi:hypothetical protein